jgi:hypothetical protein
LAPIADLVILERAGRRHRSVLLRRQNQRGTIPTELFDRKAEIRCYLCDPDGYLIDIGQATGILRGIFADRPAQDD